MTEQQKLLQERLDRNYADYIVGLQGKTTVELIELAPEITAARQLREELADACTEEDVEFLLRFADPLEAVCGFWANEITGYDHSGEIGHMVWEIRDRELIPDTDIVPPPPRAGQDSVRHNSAKRQRKER